MHLWCTSVHFASMVDKLVLKALFPGGVRYPTIVLQNRTPKIPAGLRVCTPVSWWSKEKTDFPTCYLLYLFIYLT